MFAIFVRQSSLPSASSDLSLPEGELEWPETIEIEGERVELRKKNRDISCTSSYDSMEGKYVLSIIQIIIFRNIYIYIYEIH